MVGEILAGVQFLNGLGVSYAVVQQACKLSRLHFQAMGSLSVTDIRGNIQKMFSHGNNDTQVVIDGQRWRFKRLVNRLSIVHVHAVCMIPSLGEVELVVQVIGFVVAVERDGAEKPIVTETVVDLLGIGQGVCGKEDCVVLADRLLSQVVEVIQIDTQGGVFADRKQCVQIAEV